MIIAIVGAVTACQDECEIRNDVESKLAFSGIVDDEVFVFVGDVSFQRRAVQGAPRMISRRPSAWEDPVEPLGTAWGEREIVVWGCCAPSALQGGSVRQDWIARTVDDVSSDEMMKSFNSGGKVIVGLHSKVLIAFPGLADIFVPPTVQSPPFFDDRRLPSIMHFDDATYEPGTMLIDLSPSRRVGFAATPSGHLLRFFWDDRIRDYRASWSDKLPFDCVASLRVFSGGVLVVSCSGEAYSFVDSDCGPALHSLVEKSTLRLGQGSELYVFPSDGSVVIAEKLSEQTRLDVLDSSSGEIEETWELNGLVVDGGVLVVDGAEGGKGVLLLAETPHGGFEIWGAMRSKDGEWLPLERFSIQTFPMGAKKLAGLSAP